MVQESIFGKLRHPVHVASIVALWATSQLTGATHAMDGWYVSVAVGHALVAGTFTVLLLVSAVLKDQDLTL